VGACATAVQSVEVGVDTIQSGKAKIVFVGGYDDFGEEGSYEFAQMKATSNSAEEVDAGREPREMSRPASSTRSGFMEAHGAGVQVLSFYSNYYYYLLIYYVDIDECRYSY
jgi:fatty acid synthase subunit alpha, fungi type